MTTTTEDPPVVSVGESGTERRPGEFRVGDRVRLTSGLSHHYVLGGVYTGTVVEPPAGASPGLRDYTAVKLDRPAGPGAFNNGIYALRPDQMELIEDEPEPADKPAAGGPSETANGEALGDALVADQRLTEATARAERAERELAAFRERVRDAVIEEADRRGWCSEVDTWLESIGLEPREPDEREYSVYVSATLPISATVSVMATDEDDATQGVDTGMVLEALAERLGVRPRNLHDYDIDWEIDSVEPY